MANGFSESNVPGRRSERQSEVIETNLSRVFLSPDRVYKMLKPVRTTFVDFTDRGERLAAATAEFELNRRISPDVYLGLVDVEEHGSVVDRMIVMDRLPDDRRLDRLLDDPGFSHQLRRVARLVAAFHAGQPIISGPEAGVAGVDALRRNWADNFDVLAPLVGPVIPAAEFERSKDLVGRYLAGRETLFAERIEQGWVRDGHGDLRCEHVFCMDDGPRLIDCLAFRDDFRVADVLNDVAFLAMDLHRLAGPGAAKWFIESYDGFSHERHPSSLAHHYVAYRAAVRAKVAAIADSVADVLTFHRLALQHLEVGQPRCILVGGGAGVGKSTVAGGLADRLAVTWLRADEIRKELAGIDYDQHSFSAPDAGIYSPPFTDAVYDEMLSRARLLLQRGESVVLDASWASAHHRKAARQLAASLQTSVVELHCSAPPSVARERIARRMASVYNPSDATPEIADHLAARFQTWDEATVVNTNQPVARTIEDAYCSVMADTSDSDCEMPPLRVDEVGLTSETIALFLARSRSVGRWR